MLSTDTVYRSLSTHAFWCFFADGRVYRNGVRLPDNTQVPTTGDTGDVVLQFADDEVRRYAAPNTL